MWSKGGQISFTKPKLGKRTTTAAATRPDIWSSGVLPCAFVLENTFIFPKCAMLVLASVNCFICVDVNILHHSDSLGIMLCGVYGVFEYINLAHFSKACLI